MIEAGVAEVAGIRVAVAARPLEMVSRRLMAGRAVRITNGAVIEAGVAEIARVRVAGSTRSLEVIGRRLMASRAVRAADGAVVKYGVAKIGGIGVASFTCALEVVGRRLVAGGAVRAADSGMVKHGVAEIGGVGMAGAAGALEVVGRRLMTVGAILAAHHGMIEVDKFPAFDDVAVGAGCAVLAFVRFVFGVTVQARGACALVVAGGMTGGAFQVVVAAGKGEEAVVHCAFREGNGARINEAAEAETR